MTDNPPPSGPPGHTPITVWVPDERLSAFHGALAAFYAAGRDETPRSSTGPAALAPGEDACTRWWQSLTQTERALWGMWADHAPHLISSTEIVERLGLKSVRVISGALAWSSRKGAASSWHVEWTARDTPSRDAKLYGITDTAYAAKIRAARDEAQAAEA